MTTKYAKTPDECSLGDTEGVRILLRMFDEGDNLEHPKVIEANKRRQQWRTGSVRFHVPPVPSNLWDEAAWIAYASSYWARTGRVGHDTPDNPPAHEDRAC